MDPTLLALSDCIRAGMKVQVNTLIYVMGAEANDILRSFALSKDDRKSYAVVKGKLERHFMQRRNVIFE